MKQTITYNGRRIGYIIYDVWSTDTLFAHTIALHESYRGKGLFKILMAKLKEIAVCNGCSQVLLEPGDPLHVCNTPQEHQTYIEHLKTIYAAKGFREQDGLMALELQK